MNFDELFANICEALQREQRISYRALRRRFELSDDDLEDITDELIHAKKWAIDEDSRVLEWVSKSGEILPSASQPDKPETQTIVEQTQSVQETSSPGESPTPDAERRQLTVMFVDLVGSTSLSGELDPEDLRDVVREYQKFCTEVITRYDGHVAQLLGDGLLVYFGYPQAHEDDAQRAIHTGLGIIKAIGDLNTNLEQGKGVKLAVRLGIHTGLVVIGQMGGEGRQEQLALGETPNIAARIQGLAEPDTIVISEATSQLVQGYFHCDELGVQNLRGVAQPINVYRVLEESGAQSRLDVATSRGLTPLVGRESEVALLLERWEQVKESQGQIVLLSGEAGIGKSRLIQVLRDHVTGDVYTLLECRSSPYYQNTALYPITDLLQRMLGWQPDETPDVRLMKLEQMLRPYPLGLEESVPLFATLLSLPLPEERYPPLQWAPERQRQETLEAILSMPLELAERQPVVFVLEDLHWTDPTTLEWLKLLIDQAPTASLLTVLTCRPEFAPPWGLRSHLTPIALNRFTRSQTECLVERVTGGKALPVDAVQQIVEKTDGVPLFIEEMTKSMLESGVFQETNGHYEFTGPMSSLAIPTTLQDSLMARLDRLDTAKPIAQLGATIGRQFSYELLHAVSPSDEETLQRALGRLVEAELVYRRGLGSKATYTFKHAMVQDAAYQSLLRSTRQQVHQTIAHVLEAHFPETAETQPELLAYHYTEADCHQEAAVYWRRAGECASAGSAYVEAVAHFQKGLEILQPLPETAEWTELELALQLGLGASLIVSQGWTAPAVEQAYVRAYELCQQLGEPPTLITVLQELRRLYALRALRGDQDATQKARELGEQLLALAQRQNDPALLQDAHWGLGQTLHFLGELNAAYKHLEQSSAFYTPQPLLSQASRDQAGIQIACLFFTGMALWQLGYPDQALKASHDGLALAHELSHLFTLAFALEGVALLHQFRREVQATRQQTEAMIALVDVQGFSALEPIGSILLVWTLTMGGERQEVIMQIRQAMSTLRGGIDNGEWAFHYARLAEAYGAVGQAEEGLQSVAEALALIEKTGFRVFEPELHRVQGELLLQYGGDVSQIEACFHRALDVSRYQEATSLELRAATSLARLWQSQGKRHEAYDLLDPVYDWFTEGFDTADLIDAKALLEALLRELALDGETGPEPHKT